MAVKTQLSAIDTGRHGRCTDGSHMRSSSVVASLLASLLSVLVATGSARADETDVAPAPAADPAPATPAAPAPVDASPTSEAPTAPPDGEASAPSPPPARSRGEGFRLGLELGYQRAVDGNPDRLHAGSPSVLPLGVHVSYRTSAAVLLGVHASVGLASRDDCISRDSCRARAYAVGAHIETALGKGTSVVPWLRYGVGYELLYQGGLIGDARGHVYRSALDFLDLRFGVDFIARRGDAGKTMRIGPYVGMVAGALVAQSGVSYASGRPRDLDRDSGSAHAWMTLGVRGTLDP